MRLTFALTTLAFAAACGLSPFGTRDGRCDLRPAKGQCTDIRGFSGPSLVTFQMLCGTLTFAIDGGSYAEGQRCDTTDSVGGCQTANLDGSKQTNWYFNRTEESARGECANAMTFVPPTP